jgi:hypothetical protein
LSLSLSLDCFYIIPTTSQESLNHRDLVLQELQTKTTIVPPTVFEKNISTPDNKAQTNGRDNAHDNNDTNIKLDQVLLKLDAVIQEKDVLRNALIRENEWRRQQVNVVLFMLLAAAVHYLFPN